MQNSNVFWREVDETIMDSRFATQTLELLKSKLDENSLNWNNSNFLATLIVLTGRISSLTEDGSVKVKAFELLKACRDVAMEWRERICALLAKMSTAPKEELKEMRMKLVQISALSALTFAVNQEDRHRILRSETEVVIWFESIRSIHDNILLTESSLTEIPTGLRNLLRWVRRVGVLQQNHLYSLPAVFPGFLEFVKVPEATLAASSQSHCRYEGDSQQVIRCTTTKTFQIDTVSRENPISTISIYSRSH
jgi:hypothetical protein